MNVVIAHEEIERMRKIARADDRPRLYIEPPQIGDSDLKEDLQERGVLVINQDGTVQDLAN